MNYYVNDFLIYSETKDLIWRLYVTLVVSDNSNSNSSSFFSTFLICLGKFISTDGQSVITHTELPQQKMYGLCTWDLSRIWLKYISVSSEVCFSVFHRYADFATQNYILELRRVLHGAPHSPTAGMLDPHLILHNVQNQTTQCRLLSQAERMGPLNHRYPDRCG